MWDPDDINMDPSLDCNANGVPDECEVPPIDPGGADCNANGMPDDCESELAPSIVEQPASMATCQGEFATFTVGADGAAPLSYQWRMNGGEILNATASFYTIDTADVADSGDYDVVVTDACGIATSEVASLTVVTSEECDEGTFCNGTEICQSGECVDGPDPCVGPQRCDEENDGCCLPHDMNNDGFSSIIGDVPSFVDCVYFGNCTCPSIGCVCPGDCNCDGFLSIIGDVPCFVDCVFFGTCQDCPARSE